ncbi:MAG: hypothetical protein KGH63_01455, partial [Candidatus Micrarchaeota archaeon]|nr:hypothetical protein [Candidatus Micrarchaeota archaeon]
DCLAVVHKLPDRANPTKNWKYYYLQKQGSQVPANLTPKTFNITVANPTTCNGTILSASPGTITNVLAGQSTIITLQVRNPQTGAGADFITPEGVTTSSAGWTVSEANPPGRPANGFGVPLAPGATATLLVNLTSNGAGAGPVPLTILFNSSTPLCNNLVCNSTATINLNVTPYSCAVTTNWTNNHVVVGNSMTVTTTCSSPTGPVPCPQLDWWHNCTNASLWDNTNPAHPPYKALLGNPPPYTTPNAWANSQLAAPEGLLYTYAGETPTPLTCDVYVNGTLNNTNFTCNTSGSGNKTPITVGGNCTINVSLVYINPADAGALFIPHKIPIGAVCADMTSGSDWCPRLTWTTDAGTMGVPNPTASGNSTPALQFYPINNTLTVGNLKGTYVAVNFTDPFNNFCNYTLLLNRTKPDLVCTVQVSADGTNWQTGISLKPQGDGTFKPYHIRLITSNQGGTPTVNTTYTRLNVSGTPFTTQTDPAGQMTGPAGAISTDYTAGCSTPGVVLINGYADYTWQESESREDNNACNAIVNCGPVLACPDYI